MNNTAPTRLKSAMLPAMVAVWLASLFSAYSFTAVYSFGDSFTDTGRIPANSSYYQGRWSNGSLWVEYLSASLGIAYNTTNNVAYAGSTTSDLAFQLSILPVATNYPTSIFTILSGSGDFVESNAGGDDAAWASVISNAVLNITNTIQTLYTNGARYVIVANLPNLALTPLFGALPGSASNYLASKVVLFNGSLGASVTNLMQGDANLRIYFMDLNQLWSTVYTSPATYGFTVESVGALEDTNLTDKSFTGPGANYFFWDTVHPTTKMHAMMGALAYDLVGTGLQAVRSGTNLNLRVANLYPSFQYTIQSSSNLVTWSDYESFTAASTNLALTVTNVVSGNAFYRVRY